MKRKLLKWGGITLIVASGISLFTLVVFPYICLAPLLIFTPAEGPLFAPPVTPVEYALPPSAKILEQDSTPADFFGDYSYCAAFSLAESEIAKLIEERFDWVTSDGRDLPTEMIDWREGKLPEEIVELAQGFGTCRKQVLDKSRSYRYLYKRVEGGQERLFVIDEEQGLVYYHRNSW